MRGRIYASRPSFHAFNQPMEWTPLLAVEAIRAFGGTSNHLGVAEITKLLGDPDAEVGRKAARALKQLDPETAVKAGVK